MEPLDEMSLFLVLKPPGELDQGSEVRVLADVVVTIEEALGSC